MCIRDSSYWVSDSFLVVRKCNPSTFLSPIESEMVRKRTPFHVFYSQSAFNYMIRRMCLNPIESELPPFAEQKEIEIQTWGETLTRLSQTGKGFLLTFGFEVLCRRGDLPRSCPKRTCPTWRERRTTKLNLLDRNVCVTLVSDRVVRVSDFLTRPTP